MFSYKLKCLSPEWSDGQSMKQCVLLLLLQFSWSLCGWVWPVSLIIWTPVCLYVTLRSISRQQQRVRGKPVNPKQLTSLNKCQWLRPRLAHLYSLYWKLLQFCFFFCFAEKTAKLMDNKRRKHHWDWIWS